MHFQFLIEDQSSAELLEILMHKISKENPCVTYNCKAFKGIGGFTKRNTVKETKSGKLLNDLATYLRGFNRSLQHIDAVLMIVLDNDDRDTDVFRRECPTYIEIGKHKSEWARRIGQNMMISENKSPSFQYFIHEIYKRLPAA